MTTAFDNKIVTVQIPNNPLLEITLTTPIGCGGSKCAFKITSDLVLILPNVRGKILPDNFSNWEKVVNEEIQVSQLLTTIEIYNPNHKKVIVNIDDISFESYISKSFEGLKSSGLEVIDMKNISDTYNIFYDPNIDLLNINNWLPILSNLMEDIIILYKYRIPISSDSINYVLVKTNNLNLISSYEVRFFGFDFTSKIERIKINTKVICWNKKDYNLNFYYYNNILDRAIENLMFYVADIKYNKKSIFLSLEEEKILDYLQSYFKELLKELYHTNSDNNC